MTPLDFHQTMMMLSTRFAFSVTSSYRTVKHNDDPKIVGKPDSRHLLWMANDILLDNSAETDAFKKEAARHGLVVVDEDDHLHVQGG